MQDRFKFKIYNKLKKCFIDENEIFLRGNGEFVIIDKEFNRTWIKNNSNYKKVFCTGLKDKNGKLIFEGDIVKIFHVSGTMQDKYFFDVVEWNDLRCRFDTKNYGIIEDDDVYEVIGNIYEKEELLNGNNP